MPENPAAGLVAKMSVADKAALTTGASFWYTAPVDSVGLPAIMLTDGPHGLRKQATSADHLGLNDSVPATCFPPAVTLASTWDPALAERVGAAIGREAKAEQVSVVLGPGVNVKRSIRCGRNFEYMSEDPLLAGHLGAAWVRGVQSQGVGTSLKHFAGNSQEDERLRVDMHLDERTLREIELRAFERVVREARPWTVMCAYNKLNGEFASQHRWLLTTVLRDEWGFDGLVVSDWGAVHDRVASLVAGLDLEMPSTGGRTAAEVEAAVADGTLAVADLDLAARRVTELVLRSQAGLDRDATFDVDAHHALAREVAAAGTVLLKNDGGLLPLTPGASLAVVGEFARTPRYQGAGSSQINPTRLDTALEALQALAGDARVTFAPGFTLDSVPDEALAAEAVRAAAAADVAVLFLGLPAADESEGYDREHIELPQVQLDLLDQVLAVNPRVVVVLSNGSAVRVSGFADRVPALLEGWLLGQAGGSATADVLFGVVDPSGRTAETVPVRLQDTPDYTSFPGENLVSRWDEGVFVGYRWYDARELEVSFPFGHGLSYTTFAWSDLEVTADADGVQVALTVTNTGARAGSEVVQIYTGMAASAVRRAPRELRAFTKVHLEAGASTRVRLTVPTADLAHWSTRHGQFVTEGGELTVWAAASSRDLRLQATVTVDGDEPALPLTVESTIQEWLDHATAGPVLLGDLTAAGFGPDNELFRMLAQMPARQLSEMLGAVTRERLDEIVAGA